MHPTTIVETLNRVSLGQAVEPTALERARVEFGLAPNGEEWPDLRVWARPEPSAWAYGMPAWEIGPDEIQDADPETPPCVPRDATADALPLTDWLRSQVAAYRALGTEAADLVAQHLGDLVAEAEITGARTPGQLVDRRDALMGCHA